jgi:hypothetical protein
MIAATLDAIAIAMCGLLAIHFLGRWARSNRGN